MIDVYIGIGIFLFVYLCYLLLIILNKKKLNKYINKSRETNMIKMRYNLNYDKISHKLVANLFGLTNGFILGLTYVIMTLISNFILKLLLSLVFMTIIIIILYMLIGKYLKKKEV